MVLRFLLSDLSFCLDDRPLMLTTCIKNKKTIPTYSSNYTPFKHKDTLSAVADLFDSSVFTVSNFIFYSYKLQQNASASDIYTLPPPNLRITLVENFSKEL